MTELWQLSAAQLVAGYRAREFSPVQAAASCLARIQLWQPALNALVCVDTAGALRAANASQARWAAGTALGPLDGVPLTLKDNLHAAGLPTTWGSALLRGYLPPRDELPVQRLRDAGAVLLGKTNLPEFALQGYTDNRISGPTRNPWDRTRTPGGSSGGAAAAVAAGCGPLALCSDGGGSTRRPASHTGLVGFKPSVGVVPRAHGLPEIFLDYEVVGGLARNVADVRTLMGEVGNLQPLPPHLPPSAAGRRLLYIPRFGQHPVDPGITARVREAAHLFESLGYQVEEAAHFDLAEDVNALWSTLSCAGLAWMLARASQFPAFRLAAGASPALNLCTEAAQAQVQAGQAASGTALFDVLAAVHTLRQRLAALFARHDFLLTPATAALPWPVGDTHPAHIDGQQVGPRGHAVFTAFANAAGLPAIALPTAPVRGLPTGLQLVGRPLADAGLLALAAEFEQAQGLQPSWPCHTDPANTP